MALEDNSQFPGVTSPLQTTNIQSSQVPRQPTQAEMDYLNSTSSQASAEALTTTGTPKVQSKIEELGMSPLSMGSSPLSSLVNSTKIGSKLSPINFSQSLLANPTLADTAIGRKARSSSWGKKITSRGLNLPGASLTSLK